MKQYVTIFIFIFLWANKVFCQEHVDVVNELNKIIRPISNINPEGNFEDIEFLKDVAKDATIIGIGESTHGTSLYNIYRQRLVRFLVQEMGYKAIIDEGDILAAERLDDYINGKNDSLEFIGGLRPVVTNKKELTWLKEYNSMMAENQRVHIYGAEVRGFYGIVQKIKNLFPNASTDILKKFEGNIGVGYANITKKDFEDISNLSQTMEKESNNLKQVYYLSLLNQQIDFAYRQRFGRNDFNVRDQYMFENIKHIVSSTVSNKAIILAHNGHLQKTKFTTLTSLGYLLNNFYSSKYFVAATDFNTGNVSVYNFKNGNNENEFFSEVQDKNAVEYILSQCKYPNFFLSSKDAIKNSTTASFVNKKIKMLRNMGTGGDIIKSPVSLAENYDLIIFFNNTETK